MASFFTTQQGYRRSKPLANLQRRSPHDYGSSENQTQDLQIIESFLKLSRMLYRLSHIINPNQDYINQLKYGSKPR